MSSKRSTIISLALGLVFGEGLVISGMTDPAKVRAFLDVRGAWDPSLAFVMGSAVATCAALYAIARRRNPPPVALTETRPIDARLISGAAIFGVGWGLVGACPGPAIVLLGSGAAWSFVFVFAMLVGSRLASARIARVEEATTRRLHETRTERAT